MQLYRYRMAPEKKDRSEVILGPEKEFLALPEQARFTDRLPARSMTAYSTYHMEQNATGVTAE